MLNNKHIYLILIILCLLVYSNSLNNAFVSDDIDSIRDVDYIVKNSLINQHLGTLLLPSTALNYLNYFIAGKDNPFVYHLTNILLHAIATILIFFFLRLFFRADSSLVASSLFAVHPIHAEAVTWISGRPYIMTAIFILIGYFLYNKAIEPANKDKKLILFLRPGAGFKSTFYWLCIIIFSYYLIFNFSFYFIFPVFLILSDITFKRWRRSWKLWIPFFAIVAFRLILAKGIILGRISSVAKEAGIAGSSWTNPSFNMAYSLFAHLGLLIWPAKLTLYHEPPVISIVALRIELIILFIVLPVLLFIFFKKAKALFLGLILFIIFLAPTYSPVMISWLLAERYIYFPSVALSIFAAFFYERYIGPRRNTEEKHVKKKVAEGIEKTEAPQRKTALILFTAVIAAYGVRTVARNEDWKTPQSLWRQTVLVSPKSPRAHNNMADAYGKEGNIDAAIGELKKAIELNSGYADAYHNLGNIYNGQGNINEAVKYYKLAITFNPQLFESYFNLGVIYLNNGECGLAIGNFNKALQLRPGDTDVSSALSFAIKKQAEK